MKFDDEQGIIINDAGYTIARDVPSRVGFKLVRSQVFYDRLVEALCDLLSTEKCVCLEAEMKKGSCSVCRYNQLIDRIHEWPMKAPSKKGGSVR